VPRKTKTASKETEMSRNGMTDAAIASEKAPRRAPAKARKAPAKKATKRAAKTSPTAGFEPNDEQIRIRAYFIAERRHRLALPGNADSDWLEAKRQLQVEAGAH
jgi:hypothetical protein